MATSPIAAAAASDVAEDDSRLLVRAAEGDGAAFGTLYDRHERAVFNFCRRVLGSDEDAADATQETFVKVLQRLPTLEIRASFKAYLFGAARNAAYDMIRARKRIEPVDEVPEGTVRDGPSDLSLDPERSALLADFRMDVRVANARLPMRQREVLALRELEGLSYEEIADVMRMNANSVAQLISRARIKLRDELRGTAVASIAASSPECERALPLLARRNDGNLDDDQETRWLRSHLTSCPTCQASEEAMQEAGVSYRAWAPIVPLLWLRRATVARAAETTNADWSERMGGGHTAAQVAPGAGMSAVDGTATAAARPVPENGTHHDVFPPRRARRVRSGRIRWRVWGSIGLLLVLSLIAAFAIDAAGGHVAGVGHIAGRSPAGGASTADVGSRSSARAATSAASRHPGRGSTSTGIAPARRSSAAATPGAQVAHSAPTVPSQSGHRPQRQTSHGHRAPRPAHARPRPSTAPTPGSDSPPAEGPTSPPTSSSPPSSGPDAPTPPAPSVPGSSSSSGSSSSGGSPPASEPPPVAGSPPG